MKSILLAIAVLVSQFLFAGKVPPREYYELRVYRLATSEQEQTVDAYLEKALLPALHKVGIKAGVYKPIANDTASVKKIVVLIPYKSPAQAIDFTEKLSRNASYLEAGKEYLDAAYNKAPYTRFESMLLKAFPEHPVFSTPKLEGDKSARVYELRSYEGPTEKLYLNKVDMFNAGGEVKLFKRLGFNAVFYAEVLFGSQMPNLMYMTSFDNMESRDAHWKTFSNDAEWKKISGMDKYKNNVSHADIILMHPASYSDL